MSHSTNKPAQGERPHFTVSFPRLAWATVSMIAGLAIFVVGFDYPGWRIFGLVLQASALALAVISLCKNINGPFEIMAAGLSLICVSFSVASCFTASLQQDMSTLVANTILKDWDWLALIVAAASLIFAACTWISQEKTQKNTTRISPQVQREILLDYYRHTYRNIMVVYALERRIRGRYDHYYPAEEHIYKLRSELSAVFPEIFIDDPEKCREMHDFKFNLRNPNIELDVAVSHFLNPNISAKVKERDMARIKQRLERIIESTTHIITNHLGYTRHQLAREALKYVRARAVDKINHEEGKDDYVSRAREIVNREDFEPLYEGGADSSYIKALFPDGDEAEIREFVTELNVHILTWLLCPDEIVIIPFDKEKPFINSPEQDGLV